MTSISCLIIDDESLAREGLERYVKQIDFLDLKGVCKNALQAQSLINKYDIDLLFLDIEMPKISGIDFLKSFKQTPYIVFTTAYSQYAIESFEFDVIDYLVKPITFERFLQAANKSHRLINLKKGAKDVPFYFFVKVDGKLAKLQSSDILFIEAVQNYINIYTSGDKYMVLMPLKTILSYLPEDEFVQTHKSYIVSKRKINEIEGNLITIGLHKIPISRRMKEVALELIVSNKLIDKKK
jgi:DNA-binding LytR/AlgR family response regulator